jgi:hypothetical protein
MAGVQPAEEECGPAESDQWMRRLASDIVGKLPIDHADALQVLVYVTDQLAHADSIPVPIHAEAPIGILKFERKIS